MVDAGNSNANAAPARSLLHFIDVFFFSVCHVQEHEYVCKSNKNKLERRFTWNRKWLLGCRIGNCFVRIDIKRGKIFLEKIFPTFKNN